VLRCSLSFSLGLSLLGILSLVEDAILSTLPRLEPH
jgi:hypothetical protein